MNWEVRELQTSNPDYYLDSISFSGAEGWIAGAPKVLLHTEDEGANWLQIPLSEKLPGDLKLITAIGDHSAEIVTTVGAIYRTQDGGKTWQALVDDAVGVLRTVNRFEDGSYLAVSSRGNFFARYLPGERNWEAFQRATSRRLQNMGFGPDGKAWRLNQGAEVALTDNFRGDEWTKPFRPGKTLSFGYLDAAYRTPDDLWIVGGSALAVHSPDGGKTWERAAKLGNIPANFYTVTFPQPDQGFILGQRGTLLRYTPTA